MGLTSKKYQSPPRTAIEVFEMLPDGTLAEVINNQIFMSPAPSFEHQDVSLEIASLFRRHTALKKLGKCLTAPLDVYFSETDILQPDIVFIANDNMNIVKDGKIKGAPDLIIEVLSPGNKKHDTETKKPIYEKHGVKEYFIVDPITKEVLSYFLEGKKYVKQQTIKGIISSVLFQETFSF